jgi:5,10-methylenetetrahydromethanopterin reductase
MAAAAARAEDLGFDAVWFPDSQLLWRDAYASAAAAAMATSRIDVGIAVTNVGTRHPSVVASAARTVAEVAPRRFVLGVGAGDSALRPMGRPPTRRAELEAALEQVRGLLAGGGVDLGGGPVRLRDPRPVPIYVAANGPKNLAFAGTTADGVIVLSGGSVTALGRSVDIVRRAAEAAGRRPDELRVVVSGFGRVTDDADRDARLLKPICAAIAQTGGAALLALAGIALDVPDRVPGVHPDLVHADDWDAAVDICGQWVDDEAAQAFAREFAFFGTVTEIRDRLRAVADAGATDLLLQHVGSYDLPVALMEALGPAVAPETRG